MQCRGRYYLCHSLYVAVYREYGLDMMFQLETERTFSGNQKRCMNFGQDQNHLTYILTEMYLVHFSKMCFRAWLHDVKLELFNKQKEARVVKKHFNKWKKRIDLNSIATEMVRRK